MGYLCLDCGNTDSFRGVQNYRKWGWETVYLDGSGEITDWGDGEDTDSESEGIEDVECSECDSGNVEWFNNEDDLNEERAEIMKRENALQKITNWKKEFDKK